MFGHSTTLSATPQEVFDLVWDLEAQKRIDSRVLTYEKVEPGPAKVGDHLNVVLRFGNRVVSSQKTVVALSEEGPPFVDATEERPGLGVTVHTTTTLEACPEGTRVSVDFGIRPAHLLGYLGWPIYLLTASFVLRRELQGWFERMEAELQRRRASPPEVSSGPEVRGMTSVGRCPYCHDQAEVSASVACASCMSRHHTECWDELGECASCGARVRFTATEETSGRVYRQRPPLKE